jgi:hypothetical protein
VETTVGHDNPRVRIIEGAEFRQTHVSIRGQQSQRLSRESVNTSGLRSSLDNFLKTREGTKAVRDIVGDEPLDLGQAVQAGAAGPSRTPTRRDDKFFNRITSTLANKSNNKSQGRPSPAREEQAVSVPRRSGRAIELD